MPAARRWFWPLIAAAVAFACTTSVLVALALENPTEAWLPGRYFEGGAGIGACLSLLNLFAPPRDPFDGSDVPLLVAAAISASCFAVAVRHAWPRR